MSDTPDLNNNYNHPVHTPVPDAPSNSSYYPDVPSNEEIGIDGPSYIDPADELRPQASTSDSPINNEIVDFGKIADARTSVHNGEIAADVTYRQEQGGIYGTIRQAENLADTISLFGSRYNEKEEQAAYNAIQTLLHDPAGRQELQSLGMFHNCAEPKMAQDVTLSRFLDSNGHCTLSDADLSSLIDNHSITITTSFSETEQALIKSAVEGNRPGEIISIFENKFKGDPLAAMKFDLNDLSGDNINSLSTQATLQEIIRNGTYTKDWTIDGTQAETIRLFRSEDAMNQNLLSGKLLDGKDVVTVRDMGHFNHDVRSRISESLGIDGFSLTKQDMARVCYDEQGNTWILAVSEHGNILKPNLIQDPKAVAALSQQIKSVEAQLQIAKTLGDDKSVIKGLNDQLQNLKKQKDDLPANVIPNSYFDKTKIQNELQATENKLRDALNSPNPNNKLINRLKEKQEELNKKLADNKKLEKATKLSPEQADKLHKANDIVGSTDGNVMSRGQHTSAVRNLLKSKFLDSDMQRGLTVATNAKHTVNAANSLRLAVSKAGSNLRNARVEHKVKALEKKAKKTSDATKASKLNDKLEKVKNKAGIQNKRTAAHNNAYSAEKEYRRALKSGDKTQIAEARANRNAAKKEYNQALRDSGNKHSVRKADRSDAKIDKREAKFTRKTEKKQFKREQWRKKHPKFASFQDKIRQRFESLTRPFRAVNQFIGNIKQKIVTWIIQHIIGPLTAFLLQVLLWIFGIVGAVSVIALILIAVVSLISMLFSALLRDDTQYPQLLINDLQDLDAAYRALVRVEAARSFMTKQKAEQVGTTAKYGTWLTVKDAVCQGYSLTLEDGSKQLYAEEPLIPYYAMTRYRYLGDFSRSEYPAYRAYAMYLWYRAHSLSVAYIDDDTMTNAEDPDTSLVDLAYWDFPFVTTTSTIAKDGTLYKAGVVRDSTGVIGGQALAFDSWLEPCIAEAYCDNWYFHYFKGSKDSATDIAKKAGHWLQDKWTAAKNFFTHGQTQESTPTNVGQNTSRREGKVTFVPLGDGAYKGMAGDKEVFRYDPENPGSPLIPFINASADGARADKSYTCDNFTAQPVNSRDFSNCKHIHQEWKSAENPGCYTTDHTIEYICDAAVHTHAKECLGGYVTTWTCGCHDYYDINYRFVYSDMECDHNYCWEVSELVPRYRCGFTEHQHTAECTKIVAKQGVLDCHHKHEYASYSKKSFLGSKSEYYVWNNPDTCCETFVVEYTCQGHCGGHTVPVYTINVDNDWETLTSLDELTMEAGPGYIAGQSWADAARDEHNTMDPILFIPGITSNWLESVGAFLTAHRLDDNGIGSLAEWNTYWNHVFSYVGGISTNASGSAPVTPIPEKDTDVADNENLTPEENAGHAYWSWGAMEFFRSFYYPGWHDIVPDAKWTESQIADLKAVFGTIDDNYASGREFFEAFNIYLPDTKQNAAGSGLTYDTLLALMYNQKDAGDTFGFNIAQAALGMATRNGNWHSVIDSEVARYIGVDKTKIYNNQSLVSTALKFGYNHTAGRAHSINYYNVIPITYNWLLSIDKDIKKGTLTKDQLKPGTIVLNLATGQYFIYLCHSENTDDTAFTEYYYYAYVNQSTNQFEVRAVTYEQLRSQCSFVKRSALWDKLESTSWWPEHPNVDILYPDFPIYSPKDVDNKFRY